MLIDTHCHLDFPEYADDLDEVVKRAHAQGVAHMVNIGASVQGSRNSLALAGRFECMYAAVGIHPHEADAATQKDIDAIRSLASGEKVAAIGEIGLDYYKHFSKAENQRPLFKELLALAKRSGLAVVLHCREAEDDLLAIIKEYLPIKAVVHCFSGDEHFLRQCLDRGWYASFTCNITYKKAAGLRDLVAKVPLECLMLETDSPYLSPEGFRGKRNEPFQVKLLAEEVARIRNIPFEEVARATTHNARTFFNLT